MAARTASTEFSRQPAVVLPRCPRTSGPAAYRARSCAEAALPTGVPCERSRSDQVVPLDFRPREPEVGAGVARLVVMTLRPGLRGTVSTTLTSSLRLAALAAPQTLAPPRRPRKPPQGWGRGRAGGERPPPRWTGRRLGRRSGRALHPAGPGRAHQGGHGPHLKEARARPWVSTPATPAGPESKHRPRRSGSPTQMRNGRGSECLVQAVAVRQGEAVCPR
jgi:hypothetical protein